MDIAKNLAGVKIQIPEHVKLVAVSKTKPFEIIMEAYNAGQRVFGENKVQDLVEKYESLPKDIEWHFIGHLQSNKVKYIAPFVSLIHGIDSLKLLKIIDKESVKNDRVIDCLLQFHIAEESTKFGFSKEEATDLLDSLEYSQLKNIRIRGVMGMATYTSDVDQIKSEFHMLKSIFDELKSEYFSSADYFNEISMGMSDDFQIAIGEGSTILRVGSKIFGARNY